MTRSSSIQRMHMQITTCPTNDWPTDPENPHKLHSEWSRSQEIVDTSQRTFLHVKVRALETLVPVFSLDTHTHKLRASRYVSHAPNQSPTLQQYINYPIRQRQAVLHQPRIREPLPEEQRTNRRRAVRRETSTPIPTVYSAPRNREVTGNDTQGWELYTNE